MLHSSQTVVRQTYFFDNATATNVKFQPELEENASTSPHIINISGQHIDKNIDKASTAPEQGNFALAKNIDRHKKSIISTLTQIPICALWLITKLEQNSDVDKEELSSTPHADTTPYLTLLDASYHQLLSAVESHAVSSFEVLNAKQALLAYVEHYPFSAEQLKELCTFIFFAYYAKLQQTHNYIFNPEIQDAVLSKLRTLNKHTEHKQLEELNQLQNLYSYNDALEQLLLPEDDAQYRFLVNLLLLEKQWLNARKALASANHRLVLYLANQYKGGFLDFNDLVQEGQSGLLKAVDRFDYQKGFQFSTYAAYWIRQAISRALIRNERVVRLPFGQMATIGKLHRIKDSLYTKLGYEPSIKELAEYMQLPETEINHLFYISQSATSLDTQVGEDDNTMTKADFIEQQVFEPALNTIFRKELIATINAAIKSLSNKEAQVISCRFGINTSHEMTLEEIGNELHLTRERVRQIQVTAIKKLKQYFGAELNSYI